MPIRFGGDGRHHDREGPGPHACAIGEVLRDHRGTDPLRHRCRAERPPRLREAPGEARGDEHVTVLVVGHPTWQFLTRTGEPLGPACRAGPCTGLLLAGPGLLHVAGRLGFFHPLDHSSAAREQHAQPEELPIPFQHHVLPHEHRSPMQQLANLATGRLHAGALDGCGGLRLPLPLSSSTCGQGWPSPRSTPPAPTSRRMLRWESTAT
ncbi:Hypothetical protein AA314_06082 [Archangium gephyra]|uniref:Uncharacterized protein n=1 Tax=Archangium gephyra TaxID=48 RepID=A0AAC8THE2_9BACT|nr:Hypothetical protein AA314_06082 [Archangium gephyra]